MKPFIVIAEDETSVSELLRYNLESEGYETAIANDGDVPCCCWMSAPRICCC